jgi:hypothetical protein
VRQFSFLHLWDWLGQYTFCGFLYGEMESKILNKMNLSLKIGVSDLTNKLFDNGKEKEVKFIEINEEKKIVKIFFKDFTFITLNDVKILKKDE